MILPTQTTHYEWEILQNHHAFAACFIPPKRVPFNDPCINKPTHLHPQKLTWNLQNTHQKEKEKHLYTNTNHPFFGGGFKRLVLKGRLYFNQYPNNVCFFFEKKTTQHKSPRPPVASSRPNNCSQRSHGLPRRSHPKPKMGLFSKADETVFLGEGRECSRWKIEKHKINA